MMRVCGKHKNKDLEVIVMIDNSMQFLNTYKEAFHLEERKVRLRMESQQQLVNEETHMIQNSGDHEGIDVEEVEAQQQAVASNGGSQNDVSRLRSFLVSKDRDFVISNAGLKVKVSDLEGKIIGLYFSANWYPPCRNFTQTLSAAYNQLKANESEFEIIFVSSDEDLNAFSSYFSTMPWLAIPYSDLNAKKLLNKIFDVEGIPCLVILQPEGYTDEMRDGVELIYRYGVHAFPFSQRRVEELEQEEKAKHESQTVMDLLTNHDRDYLLSHSPTPDAKVPVSSLIGKTVGLYFCAQWCVPGLNFTPKLVSIYLKINQMLRENGEGNGFEIVFVSTDRDGASFRSYFDSMPWLALPFGDPTVKDLTKYFDVRGIPCLVILGPDGKTITKHGRNLVNLYQENAYPFTKAKLQVLEKQMEEEAKSFPKSVFHEGHRHELKLVSDGNGGGPFICCDCDEQGLGWAYQCMECGYEVHPRCIRAASPPLPLSCPTKEL